MSEIMYSIGIVNKDGSAIQESVPESVVCGGRARAFFDKVGFTASLHWLTPFNDVPYGDIKPVVDDNGNVIVRVPRFNEGEWGRMVVLAESVADSLEAMFGLGFEDGQTVKKYESEVDGYSITIEKSVPAPKRLFVRYAGAECRDWVDIDDGEGNIDDDSLRSYIESVFDENDFEDEIAEYYEMDEDICFDAYENSYSYTKREILENVGDWDSFIGDARYGLQNAVVESFEYVDPTPADGEEKTIHTEVGTFWLAYREADAEEDDN